MNKPLDQRGRVCESSGKFTEPRQKEVSGSFDSTMDMKPGPCDDGSPLTVFCVSVQVAWSAIRTLRTIAVVYGPDTLDEFIRAHRDVNPNLWQEAIKDPRVTRDPSSLSIKSISKQVKTHQSAKRHSWWNT